MKKITLLSIFCGVFCFVTVAQKASITGKTTPNNKGKTVYLNHPDMGLPRTDSAKIDAKGAFTFTKEVAFESFYELELEGKKKAFVWKAGDALKATTNATQELSIIGSAANSQYYELIGISNKMKASVDSMQKVFEKAVADNNTSKQQALQQEYQRRNTETQAKIRSMFPAMGSSIVAMFATNFFDPEQEGELLKAVADKLKETKSGNPQVSTFLKNVAKLNGAAIGSPAPEIAYQTPAGETLTLSSLKGKYILIDFWASWCGPCRRENPTVVRIYNKYKEKGFEILGVSLDNNKDSWVKAIEKDELTWKHVSELKQWQSSVVPEYGIKGIPLTVLVDKEGNIIAKNLRGESLEAKLAEIFN
jgi:thiol-disulfide isomerase/thioredoxin